MIMLLQYMLLGFIQQTSIYQYFKLDTKIGLFIDSLP